MHRPLWFQPMVIFSGTSSVSASTDIPSNDGLQRSSHGRNKCIRFKAQDEFDETLEYTPSNGSQSARHSMPLFTVPFKLLSCPSCVVPVASAPQREYTDVDVQHAAHASDERHVIVSIVVPSCVWFLPTLAIAGCCRGCNRGRC